MAKLPIYKQDGGKTEGTMELPAFWFDAPYNADLIHEAYVAQHNASRKPIAHTKTRDERRGGGIKPWAQKGTGRARQGSRRSPQWRKGGVVFGPRGVESYAQKINQKARQKALASVLSKKVRDSMVAVYDVIALKEMKTKEVDKLLEKVPFKNISGCLMIVSKDTDKVIRAARNHPAAKAIRVNNLNIADLIHYEGIVFEKKAIEELTTVK